MSKWGDGVIGSLKPILGDMIVHPVVYTQIQNGRHWEALSEFVHASEYGEWRVIIDGNLPTDRVLICRGGEKTLVMTLDGSVVIDGGTPDADDIEAQEMRDIEELRRQIEALHNID